MVQMNIVNFVTIAIITIVAVVAIHFVSKAAGKESIV